MGFIYDSMHRFFTEDDWPISQVDNDPALSMTFEGDYGRWICVAQALEEDRIFLFYSASPIESPPDKLGKVAEFIAHANYGMLIGNFEVSFEDGDIRYKTSLDLRGIPDEALAENDLILQLIKQMVYINVLTMDNYLPGLKAVIEEDVAPAEAAARIDG